MCEGKKTEKLGIWMTKDLLLELSQLANHDDLSLSAYVSRLLSRHVYGHGRSGGDPPQGPDRPDLGR